MLFAFRCLLSWIENYRLVVVLRAWQKADGFFFPLPKWRRWDSRCYLFGSSHSSTLLDEPVALSSDSTRLFDKTGSFSNFCFCLLVSASCDPSAYTRGHVCSLLNIHLLCLRVIPRHFITSMYIFPQTAQWKGTFCRVYPSSFLF